MLYFKNFEYWSFLKIDRDEGNFNKKNSKNNHVLAFSNL